jgi:exopolysaccharide biosynthesis protein
MDLKRAWTLCTASRSSWFLILMSVLLLFSVVWNVWHYQLDRKRRVETEKVERTSKISAALTAEQAKLTESKRRARDVKTEARVQELYDEINQLTKLSERALLRDRTIRVVPPVGTSSEDHAVRIR